MDRRCTATSKQSGDRCKRFAIPGGTVCVMHGGKSPGVRAAAEARQQEAAAGVVVSRLWDPGAPPVRNAIGALQQLAGSASSALEVLGREFDGEPCEECGRGPERDPVRLIAWQRQQRLLHQVLESMERLGIAERHAELESAKVRLVAVAVGRVFEALGLSADQRSQGVSLLLAELRSLPAPEGPDGGGEAA